MDVEDAATCADSCCGDSRHRRLVACRGTKGKNFLVACLLSCSPLDKSLNVIVFGIKLFLLSKFYEWMHNLLLFHI